MKLSALLVSILLSFHALAEIAVCELFKVGQPTYLGNMFYIDKISADRIDVVTQGYCVGKVLNTVQENRDRKVYHVSVDGVYCADESFELKITEFQSSNGGLGYEVWAMKKILEVTDIFKAPNLSVYYCQ